MNTPPDFSKYAKQLNIEQLKKQGTQALADELSYTRQLYESLDKIFQDPWTVSLSQMAKVMF